MFPIRLARSTFNGEGEAIMRNVLPRNSITEYGNADGENIVLYEMYDVLAIGGSGLADPMVWDPTIENDDGSFGNVAKVPNGSSRRTLYDSHGWALAFPGERLWAVWRGHSQRWEVFAPFGLTRRALLSANLTVNGTGVSAAIQYDGGTYAITVDGWQVANSQTINSAERIVVDYLWETSGKWYTSAYQRP